MAPEICPKCGAPKEQFSALDSALVSLITRSRKTNTLLIEVLTILQHLDETVKAGIDDNLDPSCLNLFNRINDFSLLLKNMIKAEIQTHVSKNKWG